MKKIVIAVSLVGTLLLAEPYTKEDRVKDMRTLAVAMQSIQNGFFYNDFEQIKTGTTSLADTIEKIKPPLEEEEEKNPMTRYMNQKVKFSDKTKKIIYRKSKDLLERFKDGDPSQALQAFSKITHQCMKCHTELRKW